MVAGPNAKFSTPGAAVGLFCHTPGIPLARYIHIDNKALITRILLVLYFNSFMGGDKKVFFSGECQEQSQAICCSQAFQLVRDQK